jgi:hypothetical protein
VAVIKNKTMALLPGYLFILMIQSKTGRLFTAPIIFTIPLQLLS